MRLSKIKINNFKTFKNLTVDLNNPCLIIGSCASGKSNFVEIFEFIKDLTNDFDNAFYKHGGFYLQNLNPLLKNEPTYLKFFFDDKEFDGEILNLNDSVSIRFTNFNYEISFNFNEWEYDVLYENIEFKFNVIDDGIHSSHNTLYLKNSGGKYFVDLDYDGDLFSADDLIPNSLLNIARNNLANNNVLLINSVLSSTPFQWADFFKEIECYNFNPQFSKSISKINGDNSLLKYGENLSISLNRILKNNNDKRMFLNLLKDLLPYINDVDVKQLKQNQLFFTIFEQNKKVEVPSLFVSDGTSNVIALIVSLYFDNSKYLFIEEPERNIHPSLLSKLVQMISEASRFKQIIVTTHSPEILKFMKLDNIYLISKDDNEFTVISKPANNKVLKPFIEELGIDEIFVDNYLEWGT